MAKAINLHGKIFGSLTVLRKSETGSTSQGVAWVCLCSCSKTCVEVTKHLRSGRTTSCGHLPLHCKRGHPFVGSNAYIKPDGTRTCRACKNIKRNDLKTRVLTHYSHNNLLKCCWDGCTINDVDMLTLDHTENNGADHRREIRSKGGISMYRWAAKNNFPEGFQTLCGGHQLKKEIISYTVNPESGATSAGEN